MATIGKFTKQANGTYLGGIKTLTIDIVAQFEPATKSRDKSPDFRITAEGLEIGAAWERTSREGAKYLSVQLDDPTLVAPIYASLVKGSVENGYSLLWDRRRSDD